MRRRAIFAAVFAALVGIGITTFAVTNGGVSAAAWVSSVSARASAAAGDWVRLPPTTVTPQQLGVQGDTTATAIVDVTTPLNADGTTQDAYYACVQIQVTDGTHADASHNWVVDVDTTLPPYNATPIQQWNFAPQGVRTGTVLAGPDAHGIVKIGGAGQTSPAHPFGSDSDGVAYNTPVAQGQIATLSFCLNVSNKPGVMPAGPTTYAVGAPSLGSCQNAGGVPSQYDACAYVTVTGYYPHFFVGYTVTVDWDALVEASNLSTSEKEALEGRSLHWIAQWNGSGVADPSATDASGSYTITSAGLDGYDGGITNGMTITLQGVPG